MLYHGNRKNEIKALVIVSFAAVLLLCGVVFCFHLIVKTGRAASENTEEAIPIGEEKTEEIEVKGSDGTSEQDRIVLIKGDIHRANRYEKVDRLSYTSTVKYTKEALSLLDEDGFRLTRNEIYARHGRMFNDQILQNYFNEQSWYTPMYAPDNFNEDLLNDIEKYNVEMIHLYEINKGMNAEISQ